MAVDFDFNSWGNRFHPSDCDRSVGEALSAYYGAEHRAVDWVLEGGAISTNGAGDLLVSASSVLHPNRNGEVTKPEGERLLTLSLGVERIAWIPNGLVEDLKNTDGHVDNVAVFCGSRSILVQTVENGNPNHAPLRQNIQVIREVLPDCDIIECSRLPYSRLPDGGLQPAPYLNFVLTAGTVILPTVGSEADKWAAGFFREIFPSREVRFVPAHVLTFGGGGPHCVSMQVPRFTAKYSG